MTKVKVRLCRTCKRQREHKLIGKYWVCACGRRTLAGVDYGEE